MNNTNPSTLNRGRIQGTETALGTRHRTEHEQHEPFYFKPGAYSRTETALDTRHITGHEQHEPFYFKPGVYSRDRDSIEHKTQNRDKNKERLAMRIPPIN
jgi:adenylate cyclase class IV